MHKTESVQENDTHNILWDSEIEMNHSISVRSSDLELINKKKNCDTN